MIVQNPDSASSTLSVLTKRGLASLEIFLNRILEIQFVSEITLDTAYLNELLSSFPSSVVISTFETSVNQANQTSRCDINRSKCVKKLSNSIDRIMFYFIYQIVDEYNNEINQFRNGFNRLIIFGFRNLFYFILFFDIYNPPPIYFSSSITQLNMMVAEYLEQKQELTLYQIQQNELYLSPHITLSNIESEYRNLNQ